MSTGLIDSAVPAETKLPFNKNPAALFPDVAPERPEELPLMMTSRRLLPDELLVISIPVTLPLRISYISL